mgnify:CR=1 FL=1
MFGSHFKPSPPLTDDFACPSTGGFRAVEGWSLRAAATEVADYLTQPISSIEHKTNSSFLQQSNSAAFSNSSRLGSHSACSSQVNHLRTQLSNEVGQSSVHQDVNSSLGGHPSQTAPKLNSTMNA